MIIFAEIEITNRHKEAVKQDRLTELMQISVSGSQLVHELQKERGASAGFTNSQGQKFADTLLSQHKVTNAAYKNFQDTLNTTPTDYLGEDYNKQIQSALNELRKIEDMRAQITQLSLSLPDVVGYYTNMNAQILNITKKAIFLTDDAELLRDISAYLAFMQSKERAGIERAIGAAGFGGGWSNSLIKKLQSLVLIQDTYMDVFLTYATKEETAFFTSHINTPEVQEVQRMRDSVLNAETLSNIPRTNAEHWFKTITKKINTLKTIEDHIAKDVKTLAITHADKAKSLRNLYLTVISALVLIICVVAYFILKDLLHNIANLSMPCSISSTILQISIYR